jgi:transcriptional regulator with XRE-family HTH domain
LPVPFAENTREVAALAEDYTGARVRYWRLKRGMSQKTLAELIGMTQGYISQIESGLKEVDKRSTLVRLAQALRVSVADLTGQPYAPTDQQHAQALTAIPDVRAALISLASSDLPAKPARTMEEIGSSTDRLKQWRRTCQYAKAAPLIAPLRDLGAVASASSTPERTKALRLLVLTAHNAAFVLKYR